MKIFYAFHQSVAYDFYTNFRSLFFFRVVWRFALSRPGNKYHSRHPLKLFKFNLSFLNHFVHVLTNGS